MASEFCLRGALEFVRGRREGRVPAGTHGPRAAKSTRQNHRFSRSNRPSLRNGFTAYTWSPRGPGFLAPVIGVMRSIIANLTPASGRQDRTISPYAIRHSSGDISRPSHPALNVRDDREAPLCMRRDAGMIVLIWGLRQYPSGCGTLARRANRLLAPRSFRSNAAKNSVGWAKAQRAVPTIFPRCCVNAGHAEPVIGRAFARPGGFAHPTIYNLQRTCAM